MGRLSVLSPAARRMSMLCFPSSRPTFGLRPQPVQAAWRRARASAMLCTTTATTAAATPPTSCDAGSNGRGEDASVVVIPARFGSTRFPGKPLAHILGRPMVVHTMERASKASSVDLVAVATDHQGIKEAVEGAGGTAVMTRREHETGTDRVREALEVLGRDGGRIFGIVVNVQGDEALIEHQHIDLLVQHMRSHPSDVMSTLAVPISSEADFHNPNTVKVVTSSAGYALYFSRAGIPHGAFARVAADDRSPHQVGGSAPPRALKHVGVYAFRAAFLEAYSGLPSSVLQDVESLEQLKVMSAGYSIRVITVDKAGPDVNVPSDVQRVEEWLREHG